MGLQDKLGVCGYAPFTIDAFICSGGNSPYDLPFPFL